MALGSLALFAVFTLFSCGPHPRHCRHGNHSKKELNKFADKVVKRISWKLDLNDNQKNDLNKIKNEILQKISPMIEKRKDSARTFIGMLKKDELDAEKINTILDKHAEERKEVRKLFVVKMVDFYGTLNSEQKKEILEKVADWEDDLND